MKDTKDCKGRLDAANIQLGKELWAIKSSLAVYTIVGLNAKSIESGKNFFGFVQSQSLAAVALGLSKVFERPKSHELCSIHGIYSLARCVRISDAAAAVAFVEKYGIQASGDWMRDMEDVFSRQRPRIRRHIGRIDRTRHTRLAHIQQNVPEGNLPSIAACEDLLGFAFDFHSFVNSAFLSTTSHPILEDKQILLSLLNLLRQIGVNDPISEFKIFKPAVSF